MKINKIKINSYGKLKEKEIAFNDHLNLIYGKNEAGKSTLLTFIENSFYGISKNKRGREYSDYEKYMPWSGEEFSGKLEYELDNGEKYEIYRDFRKKNPKLFNEAKEEISKNYSVDKNKGNQFFYEQTKIDEELFLSTLMSNQQEVRLEKSEQNMLVQKIANLVGTGDDSVSYKRAIDRINRRQLDEVGTERSREKPINIVSKKIEDLEEEKENLEKYKNLKQEVEKSKEDLIEDINKLENENDFLQEIKNIEEKEIIEKEKIKIKENIKKENIEKINLIKNNLLEKEKENKKILENNSEKNKKIKNKNKKYYFIFSIIFLIIILLNIFGIIYLEKNIFWIILSLTVPTFLIFLIFFIINRKNKIKIEKNTQKNNLEKIKIEKNNLEHEINLMEKNNQELEKEINSLKNNFNLKINLEKEKIKNKYIKKIKENKINYYLNLENINLEKENLQNNLNNTKIKLHGLEIEEKNIENKLDNLAKIEEELVDDKFKKVNLENLNKSMNLAKEIIQNCYDKMKNTVTPKFTENLSSVVSEITDGKYTHVRFHDDIGLIVELDNGNYVPASKLSIGTIDQLYLSLRLSMIDELTDEKMPIILDEAFAYYDNERLENILKFILEKSKKRQVFILTCTNREKGFLDKSGMEYNFVEL